MARCVRVVLQFLFIGLVGLKVSSSIDIWSLLQQICEQMHRTDSYSKVIWCKSGELDGRMISAVVVWISSVGHLLHLILHLNPTPDEGTDRLRRQKYVLASSSILHVSADHSSWVIFS